MCNKKHLEHNNDLFVLYDKGICVGLAPIFCEIKFNVYFQFLLYICERCLKIRIDIWQNNLNEQT